MNNWERLLEDLKDYYYFEVLLWSVELAAIIIGFLTVRKQKIGILLLSYLVFDFIVFNIDVYLSCFTTLQTKKINGFIFSSNSLISLLELVTYNYFFSIVLNNKPIKKFITIIGSLYAIIVCVFVITGHEIIPDWSRGYSARLIWVTGWAFLLIPCSYYFLELLNTISSVSLFNRPSFWISTGIFLYSFISIPYHLIDRHLFENQYIFRSQIIVIIFIIPFITNLIFLIKAFLCKKNLTI